ncbi:MAG: hypothetical protein AAGI07_03225 [Bacteroidota bacterium]
MHSSFSFQNPFVPDVIREIAKSDVTVTIVSSISIMMPDFINRLNKEELKDFITYLMAVEINPIRFIQRKSSNF